MTISSRNRVRACLADLSLDLQIRHIICFIHWYETFGLWGEGIKYGHFGHVRTR